MADGRRPRARVRDRDQQRDARCGARDAGVASATVNASQQIGGSLGTALLSTIAASAATGLLTGGSRPTPALIAQAAVHGYTTAFAVSAGIFAVAAVIAGMLYHGKSTQPAAVAEPVLVV